MSKDISEMLMTLIEQYDFNKNTLSKYLEISVEQIEGIAQGKTEYLPDEFAIRHKIFSKVAILYFSPSQDEDLKLSGFLDVLISYHNLSKETIAKIAGVEVSEIEKCSQIHPKKLNTRRSTKLPPILWHCDFS